LRDDVSTWFVKHCEGPPKGQMHPGLTYSRVVINIDVAVAAAAANLN
jgi:hypothetical protein